MTTTILIGTQGNKAVQVDTPIGTLTLQPGAWTQTAIHGDQSLTIREVGEFVQSGGGVKFEPHQQPQEPKPEAPAGGEGEGEGGQ